MGLLSKDIGIDLGTANILLYLQGKGIVLREPSVVAMDKITGKLLAVGEGAKNMLGRTPGNILAIRPLREGVISDYEMTQKMLEEMIKQVNGFSLVKPRVVICVPSGISEIEERAVVDATLEAGARRVYLIEEPVAAALGAGMDISGSQGKMIVDIGGGTTDVAVLSLSGIVEYSSIKFAGDSYDEALVRYVRRKYNLLIGDKTAEEVKISIGCVYPRDEEMVTVVKGRNIKTGLPDTVSMSSTETLEAYAEVSEKIVDAVHQVLEATPPELVTDIAETGIVLTGGGSLMWGIDKLIETKTGIPTIIADDPMSCVALGTGHSLKWIGEMQEGTINLARRKLMAE